VSSKSVPQSIEKMGAIPIKAKTGHVFIKKAMQEHKAIVGGEVSGHYMFADFFGVESAVRCLLAILDLITKTDMPLSKLVADVLDFYQSEETNFHVTDAQTVILAIQQEYKDAKIEKLDGLSIDFPDYWFTARASNTEPVIRIRMEARTQDILDVELARISKFIQTFVH
jgi:phosphomannomutase